MSEYSGQVPAGIAPRFKVFLPLEMRTGAATQRVHLLDLSVSGALAHAVEAPVAGAFVEMLCAEIPRRARVMWAKEHRFGIRFTPPLMQHHVDEVIELQRVAVEQAARRIGRLGDQPRASVAPAWDTGKAELLQSECLAG